MGSPGFLSARFYASSSGSLVGQYSLRIDYDCLWFLDAANSFELKDANYATVPFVLW